MKRLGLLLTALVLAGCSHLGTGTGPDPAEYFSGADLRLAKAVRSGDPKRIDEALAAGADVEASGTGGLTMLQWAVLANSADGAAALLARGADPDRTGYQDNAALHMAVGSAALTRALLDGGADPNVPSAITGSGALTEVCLVSSDEVFDSFELLVAAGADVSLQNYLGELALHTCAQTNRGALILRMLDLGADPTTTTRQGDTFQDYYFGYNPQILNDRAIDERRQIVAWLVSRGYPIVPEAEQFR